MNSVIAIWATTVATVDALARISLILAGAATPGTARRAPGQVAAERDGVEAETVSGPGHLLTGGAGRTPAGETAQ
jgi:hypothetical protein